LLALFPVLVLLALLACRLGTLLGVVALGAVALGGVVLAAGGVVVLPRLLGGVVPLLG
jgi:hypothetical protein